MNWELPKPITGNYPIISGGLYETLTPLYLENYLAKERYVVNQGGTNSGKTYTLCKVILQEAVNNDKSFTTITGADLPKLKDDAIKSLDTIIEVHPNAKYSIQSVNRSEHVYKLKNGSVIQFKTYDNYADASAGKRDFLYCPEANALPYAVFDELQKRTSKQIYIDYNPHADFWLHEKILTRPKEQVKFIVSTWMDNPFIAPTIREEILGYRYKDPYNWAVHGRGEQGKREGLVYTDWIGLREFPTEYDTSWYWLDFGFTNDPTAFGITYKSGRNLYHKTLIYENGLTNINLLKKIHTHNLTLNDIVYADSAEPKSIADLRRGFTGIERINIREALKGPDSIDAGITKVKEYQNHYLISDTPLSKELHNYEWEQDKATGKYINKPKDAWNHALDGIRYGAFTYTMYHRK